MNGFGPFWMPEGARKRMTLWASGWFVSASWDRHDEGYARGYPSRAECDRKFLAAMLRDAAGAGPVWRMAVCVWAAWIIWALCRVGGWASYGRGVK